MASFKAIIRKDQKNKQGLSNIKIRITHNGKADYISTEYYILPKFINAAGLISNKHPNGEYLNEQLTNEINQYQRKLLKASSQIRNWPVKQIKEFLRYEPQEDIDFFFFATKRITELKIQNKATWLTYDGALKIFKKFIGLDYLQFNEIDKQLLERFESESLAMGRSINTISVYFRSIRALFNDAIDELNKDGMEPVIKNYPFRKFKIKNEITRKRNLQVEILQKIINYKPKIKLEIIAKDLFILMFYLIGINSKDLFYAQKLINDRLEFKRFKGGKKYSIRIEAEAKEIIDKYQGEKYLLKFAEGNYKDHREFRKMINVRLKQICKDLEIEKITTYWARHTWATIARNDCNISKDDISLCLGHSDPSKKITDIYLNEDLSRIDNANRMVIDFIFFSSNKRLSHQLELFLL